RPIPLRQPIVFYEGHFGAFNYITLVRRALGHEPFDPSLDDLFERGIDPETTDEARASDADWPERRTVLDYVRRADEQVRNALENEVLVDPSNPLLDRGEAVFTILEHEAMHHETLRYMLHRLPLEMKIKPDDLTIELGGEPPPHSRVTVPAGRAALGAERDQLRFGWDNEFEKVVVDVSEFEIDIHDVTNRDFLAFIAAEGYSQKELWSDAAWEWVTENGVSHPPFWERHDGAWKWRGMYELYDLPHAWPVFVTHAEASAYAKWKGRRLMSEAEFHRAAYGELGGEREQPWGDEAPDHTRGNFDYLSPEPFPAGSFPEGVSAWGIHDLVGNGWEWTATPFRPFPGFREMASYPPYSSDFFDEKHFVMKGASQATSKTLIRRSFRNWFRETYPYMYATFRTVK
ncbi:MAG: SUMF1/EgtB/PvdO family nonheme iron enzyme, partial [Thermoanaerobaculia bacterium]|nr:SUMF1/EgtB/PvdO family nonheme iron enzyme [Thermoanaerobaculia bacterium]